MKLFFWDFTDYNDIIRQWVMFVINLLALIFTSYSLYKTAKFHGRMLFELLPLSINTLGTLMLLLIKLFEKGYEFDLVGYIIEIFTYFLFCYTFSLLHARLLMKEHLPVKKFCNVLFLLLAVFAVVLIVLVMTSTIGRSCENNLIELSIAGLVTEILSYIPTLYFGRQILKNLDKKHEQQKIQAQLKSEASQLFELVSDRYVRQRRRQIQLVLMAFSLSLILRAVVLIFSINWDSFINCECVEEVYILTSDQFIGQFILVLIEINQLIPHLVIPIALFIIPVRKRRLSVDLKLGQTLIQDQEDESDHSDAVQRRISQTIQARSSLSPSKSQIIV